MSDAGGQSLAHLAADPASSRGRLYPIDAAAMRGPRDAFQRDRDRIVHSIPFRRLRGKTQVFIAPDGDHFRVRLTHSLEVAQIGRAMARALGLNEDLTEALCLAHDIGHPPFGHAGEDALSAAMADAGGFDHNGHTLRVLTRLDCPYPAHPGLNLSWETLEGLAKHNGPVMAPGWALAAADAEFPLDLASWPSLEAQIAAIADDIAYDNHDIDDGLRSGLIALDDLLTVPLVAASFDAVERRHPGLPPEALARELVRDQIGRMVNDVIAETRRRVAASGVTSPDEVRRHDGQLAGFSEDVAEAERALKSALYAKVYGAPQLRGIREQAQQVVGRLFAAYRTDLGLLPEGWTVAGEETEIVRGIGDFIAGMTDHYAIGQHRRLIGPVELPEGF